MTTVIQSILRRSDLDYDTFTDPVSKLRVSTPESLIDTDFEYGLQSIKWETLQLVNNIPTFFSRSGDTPIPVSAVTCIAGQNFVYVTTSTAHNLLNGSPFSITGLRSVTAEGTYTVTKITSSTQFVYDAKFAQTITGSIYIPNSTTLFPGMVYQGTAYSVNQLESVESDAVAPNSTITVRTVAPHGFSVGAMFNMANTYGRKQVSFNSILAANGCNINVPNHGLYTGIRLTYISNPGAGTITQLPSTTITIGSQFDVVSIDRDNFRLAAINTSTPLPIVASTVSSPYVFSTTDSATDGSDYTVTSIPSSNSFQMQLQSEIPSRSFTFIPRENMILNTVQSAFSNTIQFPTAHNLITGVRLNINGAIGGMVTNQDYFAIVVNENTIAVANSRDNAFANIRVLLTDVNPFSTNTFTMTSPSLLGQEPGSGTVSSVGNVITCTSNAFLSYFKPGMNFSAVIPAPTPTTYTITNFTGTTLTVSSTPAPNFVVNTSNVPMRWVSASSGGFVSNVIYYATYMSTNTLSLSSNLNQIYITGVASGTLQTITQPSIFTSTITEVRNSSTLVLASAPPSTLTGNTYMIQSSMFPFSDSYVYHRAFDGGIEMIPSANADAQLTRQTRKYFRYQPGKGIQCSLSINFSAPIDIESLSRSDTLATVVTRRPHRLTNGLTVTILGTNSTQWRGDYVISNASSNTFNYTLPAGALPPETIATGFPRVRLDNWSGSRIRAGLFDDHNGMFFEYDGTNMYAVRRDSVTQISGSVNVFFGCNQVFANTLSPANFTSQLTLRQNVVIRGQTYRVVHIPDNSSFFVQPPYRGTSEVNCVVSLITDTRVASNQWSIDKCDGTGPTGYNLDVTKIQMIYMDYSWYGAGKIRFGFKDTTGVVRYVHEFSHNNSFDTAYFRTGNLPARYEVYNVGAPTWVPPLLHWGTAVIMDGRYDDDKAYLFTANANVLNYTNGDTISILGTTSNVDRTARTIYDPYLQRTVQAFSITSAGGADTSSNSWTRLQNLKSGTIISGPNIQANTFILGNPQRDNTDTSKATIFINQNTTGNQFPTPVTYTFGTTTDTIPSIIPLVSIRIAPSVDSSITGRLGVRELVNHMQLRLRSVDILTTNDTELRLYLNSFISNRNFVSASPPSLSQYVAHVKGDTLQDGTILFSYRVPGGVYDSSGKRTSTVTSYDIRELGFLGNSIMGGDSVYPDGPDVLTLAAVCLDPGGVSATTPYTVTSRVTWAEAQA